MAHHAQVPTAADAPDTPRGAAERWCTRAGLMLLMVVVAAGASVLLGTRTGTMQSPAGDKVLMVIYPAISRSGESAQVHGGVTSGAGFDGTIRLAMCDELLDDLDFQNWQPNPSKESRDTNRLEYDFDPPGGHVFRVSLDARSAPGQLGGVQACKDAPPEKKALVASGTLRTSRMP